MKIWSLLFLVPLSLFAGENYEKTLEMAKKEKKHVLLFFTGSDWSGWSMKMKKEVLDSPLFTEKTKDSFYVVEVEFPEHKTLPLEESERNKYLKEKWNVHDYPRLVLIDGEERELARFAFPEKGEEAFAEELLQIVKKETYLTESMKEIETSFQLLDLYKLAQELRRDKEAKEILEVGVKRKQVSFLLEKYRFLVEEGKGKEPLALQLRSEIIQLDPLNEKGMHFSLALVDFQGLANHSPTTPAEVVRPLEDYLSAFGEKDLQNKWRLEMIIAQVYLNFNEWKTALQHAEVAYLVAPQEMKGEIAHSLDYIRQEASIALK